MKEVHCKAVPVGSEDLYDINCAFNRCDRCPKFKQPSLEKSCEECISFQTFEVDTTTMEFYSYLSDGKQQDSSVVQNHVTKLIEYLKVNKILGANSTLLSTTDGCAAQYRSGTG